MSTIAQDALFGRQEMGQLVAPPAKKVIEALGDQKWDFRTVEGIAKEVGLSNEQVQLILNGYPMLVRRSPVRDASGKPLYTLRSRKMKIAEKTALLRVFLTKTP